MKHIYIGLMLLVILSMKAQGPPITADKAIMLSQNTFLIKSLTEKRDYTNGKSVLYSPLMIHYVAHKNWLTALHFPLVSTDDKSHFGDLKWLNKYQFIRIDKKGKTFRTVLKSVQSLPTGEKLNLADFSNKEYQHYVGFVSGYETISYGISNEIGYNFADESSNRIIHKLGFGLPVLKPVYPVNQLNLYFEYTNEFETEFDSHTLLYAQGIQYAKKQFTFDFSYQIPLKQKNIINERKQSLFFGTRFVF